MEETKEEEEEEEEERRRGGEEKGRRKRRTCAGVAHGPRGLHVHVGAAPAPTVQEPLLSGRGWVVEEVEEVEEEGEE